MLRTVIQIVFGGVLGIFLLLFFMANDDWVIIRLPSAPWQSSPSWPAYEARLFGVMIISFVMGGLSFIFVSLLLGRRHLKLAALKQERIEELEKELAKSHRLIERAQNQEGE